MKKKVYYMSRKIHNYRTKATNDTKGKSKQTKTDRTPEPQPQDRNSEQNVSMRRYIWSNPIV